MRCQPSAVDEQRLQFQASPWTSSPAPGQSLTQVWFTGVHCDVGGGYPADDNRGLLAKITLCWMADAAARLGLQFIPMLLPAGFRRTRSPPCMIPRTGAYRIFPPHIRNIVADSCIASSAKQRCETRQRSTRL